MPGFLGGSSGGGGGTGGEIRFPKEFIDPVTKLRVSQPETLIDTDFEYGLQPTKWETLELINNTPSFFSKSGDTTIPGIVSITTNAGTREITVTTALDHGLAVGIPINVQGTKSVTADGSFIINSIPDTTTFTYLCKDNQAETLSIEDLYTSIVTGEFFQGAQLRISDSEGIITDDAAISELTVRTESAHGFGVNTPFYFLNLNSTVAQEFEAANTAAKSFDSSNSATAQTFDGSNTLSQIQIDFSNSATVGGTPSEIVSTDAGADTITVTHTTETFVDSQIGTPLYYDVVTSAGYFASNPRGVVFLKTTNQLASGTSIFQVSEIPDGDAINIEAAMTGTFQLANQARIFAGNNINSSSEITLSVSEGSALPFEAANDGGFDDTGGQVSFSGGNPNSTVTSYSGSLINVSTDPGAGLGYYSGAMVLYETTGGAASGLTNNTTYFIDSFFSTGTDTYAFTIKGLPTDANPISVTGGTGTQTFKRIGISLDKDIVHVKNGNFSAKDMLLYEYPVGGRFGSDVEQNYYYVTQAYDNQNFVLSDALYVPISATGGDLVQTITKGGRQYNVHTFSTVGSSTLTVTSAGTEDTIDYLIVGGGGAGGGHMNGDWYNDPGGGGGGGGVLSGQFSPTAGNYTVNVGAGGVAAASAGGNGGNSSIFNLTAIGGGGGGAGAANNSPSERAGKDGGSGGGGGAPGNQSGESPGGSGTAGQGFDGGNGGSNNPANQVSGGGGGASETGADFTPNAASGSGGDGILSTITGSKVYYGGGGGGGGSNRSSNSPRGQAGGIGGGGRGADNANQSTGTAGVNGLGGGGGGAGGNTAIASYAGKNGGSGVVIVSYPIEPPFIVPEGIIQATGGTEELVDYNSDVYRVHRFDTTGTFTISSVGNFGQTIRVITGYSSTFNGTTYSSGASITPSEQSYNVVVSSGDFVDIAYPLSSNANTIPYTEFGRQSNTSTFDFFGDGSALALYRFNNSFEDENRVYNGEPTNGVTFVSTAKFGSASVNLMGDGTYIDLPVTTRYYAVSGWLYNRPGNGYIYEFRHDNPSNGRGYLYQRDDSNINLANDSTTTNNIGDIYINGVKLTSSYNFPDNQWVHVVVSVTNPGATAQTWNAGALRLGNRSDATTNGNTGYFDQIRIFNRSLTQAEVIALRDEQEPPS